MKKSLFLIACTMLATTGFAKTKFFNDTPRIVSLDEISFEQIQEAIQSKSSDVTLELREGTVIPLQFLLKHQVFSAALNPNLVFKAEKTCYLRIVNKKCYMSDDLIRWEKPGRFTGGLPTLQLKQSVNNSGFVLETNLAPYKDDQE